MVVWEITEGEVHPVKSRTLSLSANTRLLSTMLLTTQQNWQATAIAATRTTKDMIQLWLYGKAENTQKAYRRDINAFLCFVEGKPPDRWTVNDLQAFGAALTSQGLKPSTVNRKLLAVKSCLSYAKKLGLVTANAGAAVPTQRVKDTTTERIIPEDKALEMVFSEKHPTKRLIIKTLYATGLRVSELTSLKWEDVREDGEQAVISVSVITCDCRKALITPPTSERSVR